MGNINIHDLIVLSAQREFYSSTEYNAYYKMHSMRSSVLCTDDDYYTSLANLQDIALKKRAGISESYNVKDSEM